MERYLERIIARFKHQTEKGISKYGQILEDNPRTDPLVALEYLAEELTDGLMYLEELKEKLPNSPLSFNQYQRLAERTAQKEMPYDEQLKNAVFGMVGEVGEFVDLIKKHIYHGHGLDTEKVKLELGDIGWYWQRFASILDLELEEIATANIVKLKDRYPEGFSAERSINRNICVDNKEVD